MRAGYYRGVEAHIDSWQALAAESGVYLLCLAGQDERARKSADYDSFLAVADLGAKWLEFPIPDMSIPSDPAAFSDLLDQLHGILSEPKGTVVIYCAAGIGRTGTVATALLVSLGISPEGALAAIKEAGSEPETPEQRQFAGKFTP
jgi:protein-tyrosine phosphatase